MYDFDKSGAEERNTPHCRYGLLSSRDTNTSMYVVPVFRLASQIRYAHLFTKLYGTSFEHYAKHNGPCGEPQGCGE